jgi:hypothetical protein
MQYRSVGSSPRLFQLLVLATAVLLALPSVLDAQRRRGIRESGSSSSESRGGFWGSLGVGMGAQSFRFADEDGYGPVLYQPTAVLALGGTINSNFRVGAEGQAWINAMDSDVETMASALLIAQWYPINTAGLFLKGGAGIGRTGLDRADGTSSADIGFATTLGVGAELRMGKYMFMVPSVSWVYHVYQNPGEAAYRARVINFGIALLFQN